LSFDEICAFKDAMPYLLVRIVYILHFNHILAVKPTPVNIRNYKMQLSMHFKILQKKKLVKNVWPANSAMFIYVSTLSVETVKKLDKN